MRRKRKYKKIKIPKIRLGKIAKLRSLNNSRLFKIYPIEIPQDILDETWEEFVKYHEDKNIRIKQYRESFETYAYYYFYEILNILKNGYTLLTDYIGYFYANFTDIRKTVRKLNGTNAIFEDYIDIKLSYYNDLYWELLKYFNQKNIQYWKAKMQVVFEYWKTNNKDATERRINKTERSLNATVQRYYNKYKCDKEKYKKFFSS